MVPKILFITFLYSNLIIPVLYTLFVEYIFESTEIVYLSRQFLLINAIKGFLVSFTDAG